MSGHRPACRARLRARTVVSLAVLVTALTGVAAPGSAAAAPARPAAVPSSFVPAAMSWPDADRGAVLGFTRCATGRCAAVARTWDGGRTWLRTGAPDLTADGRLRLVFADGPHGLATNGTDLFGTHTGGVSWRHVALPGTPRIHRLAATAGTFYAVTTTATGTRLLSSPTWYDRWRAVPGVALPVAGHGDIVTDGETVHVVLNAVHRAHGHWVRAGDGTWRARRPACGPHAEPDLDRAGGAVYVLCSHGPGLGDMVKDLYRANGDGTFTSLGPAPAAGVTEGFAMAAPSIPVVAAVGRGAAFLYRGRTTGGAATWHTPVTMPGGPWHDLQFPADGVGEVLYGGSQRVDAVVYRTEDAGRTWSPLAL